MDKRTFIGMVEAGEPLIQQAVDAMREYHQAQDGGAPAEEVERLRLLAESLFLVVSDYQLRVMAKARQGAAAAPLIGICPQYDTVFLCSIGAAFTFSSFDAASMA